MKNRSVSVFANSIPYIKEFRRITGSVTAAILMQQLEYWFAKYPNGFYKFIKKPSKDHRMWPKDNPNYQSWIDELGFSEKEFANAFKKIGKIYLSKNIYRATEDKFDGNMYCYYQNRSWKVFYFFRNHEIVDSILEKLITINDNGELPKGIHEQFINDQKSFIESPKGNSLIYKKTNKKIKSTKDIELSAPSVKKSTKSNIYKTPEYAKFREEVRDICKEGYLDHHKKQLDMRSVIYNTSIQKLHTKSNGNIDEVRIRADILYDEMDKGEYINGSHFLPTTLSSNWDKLTDSSNILRKVFSIKENIEKLGEQGFDKLWKSGKFKDDKWIAKNFSPESIALYLNENTETGAKRMVLKEQEIIKSNQKSQKKLAELA